MYSRRNQRRRMQRDQSGNALVLVVLVLLALTSVAMMSIKRTNTDLQVAGNMIVAEQARMMGETGAQHAQALLGKYVNEYMTDMRQQETRTLPLTTLSSSLNDRSTCVPHVAASSAADEEIARIRQLGAFDVRSHQVAELAGVTGFEANGDMCFQIFEFDALGGLIENASTVLEVQDQLCADDSKPCLRETVVVHNRARIIAGPTKCTLNYR